MTAGKPGPSHIVFATAGSLGDLYPFLALGCEMQRRGHRVTVATTGNHQWHILAAGLGFRRMRPEPEDTHDFRARYMHPKTGGEFVYKHYLAPAIRDSYDDLVLATADADLLVSQSLMALAAPLVAAKTGIPWVSAVFQPMTLFSLHDRPNYLPYPFLPWLCARYPEVHSRVFRYVREYTADWVRPVIEFRKEIGLEDQGHPMYEGQHSPRCVLAMFSPLLGGPQPDWPAATVQTGTADHATPVAKLVPGLEDFLARKSKPLAAFTQSSSAHDTGDYYRQCLRAAHMLDARALLVTSGGAASTPLPEGMQDWAFRVDYAPFERIFPHADVLVHAGGIGTAFKAMQAGVPQVFIPQAHDQLDNAMRLERRGIGALIARKRASARTLAKTMQHLMEDEQCKRMVTDAAARARAEDGAARACDEIERQLQHA